METGYSISWKRLDEFVVNYAAYISDPSTAGCNQMILDWHCGIDAENMENMFISHGFIAALFGYDIFGFVRFKQKIRCFKKKEKMLVLKIWVASLKQK